MEIIGCGKGHYYNPELYSSCPECAKENGSVGDIGATEPVDFGAYAGGVSDIGATEPVNFGAYAANTGNVGATEPVNFGGFGGSTAMPATEPAKVQIPVGGPLETDFFRSNVNTGNGGSKVQEYGATMYADSLNQFNKGIQFQPVVGWLVCIDGPAKGRDYRIHSQYNYIGRAQHMDICISGDDCISAERAAVIAYDSEEKFFSFGPSMGHNVVRVNGKMLMNAVVLNAYDELTIGKTKLLFIPLCGERFDWNDK